MALADGSGTCVAPSAVTASPQFSLFYQPNSGTVSAAVGDPSATTDGAGNITANSAKAAICDKGGQVNNMVCYGADPTGTNPSDTAFANAIAAFQSNGHPVYVPRGTYKITRTIIVSTTGVASRALQMYGDGITSVIQCTAPFTATNGACLSLTGVGPSDPFDYAANGFLRSLAIQPSGSPANLVGVYMLGQWFFVASQVSVTGFSGTGFYYPLRLDIAGGPDSYASDYNLFLNNYISVNGGNGINQECGLCTSNMTLIGNRIINNAMDGVVVGGHNFHMIGGNTVAQNGTGTAGSFNVPLSSCVGGGVVVKRIQTSVIDVVIKGNGDFDSNCLYQISLQAASSFDISDNRFIAHTTAYVQAPHMDIPVVQVAVGFGTGAAVNYGQIRDNYIRTDPFNPGFPNAATDSSMTGYQLNGTIATVDIINNEVDTSFNTANLTPYSRDGGGIITCSGTGTPACTIQQGGFYSVTPILAVPTGYGCSGVPIATLTSNVITSVNMVPVTGCTSAPPYLIISATTYPVSNVNSILIRDANGMESTGPSNSFNSIFMPIGTSGTGMSPSGSSGLAFIRDSTGTIPQKIAVVRSWTDNTDYQAGCLDYTSSVFKVGNCHSGTGGTSLTHIVGDIGVAIDPAGSATFSFTTTNFNCVTAGTCNVGTTPNPMGSLTLGLSASANVTTNVSALTGTRTASFQDSNGTFAWTSQLPSIRAGTWTVTNPATTQAVTFSPAFGSTPTSCAITPSSDPTAVGAIWQTSLSTSGFTVNVHTTPSATISGTYQCVITNSN